MNVENNLEKETAAISAYIKKVLNHEFDSLSEISGLTNSELFEQAQ